MKTTTQKLLAVHKMQEILCKLSKMSPKNQDAALTMWDSFLDGMAAQERHVWSRPDECRLLKTCHDGQAVEYCIPKRWLKIRPTRILSEEEQATRAETARKIFSRSDSPVNSGVGEVPAAGEGKDTTPPLEASIRRNLAAVFSTT